MDLNFASDLTPRRKRIEIIIKKYGRDENKNSKKSSCVEFCLCAVWHTVLNAERAGREVGEAAAHHLSQAPNQFTLTLSTLSTRPSLLYNTLISSSTTQTSNHPHCLYKPHTNQVNYQLLKIRSGKQCNKR